MYKEEAAAGFPTEPTGVERQAVLAAIRHHLGADVVSLERVSTNPARPTYSVQLADRDVVLKVLPSDTPRSVGCGFAVDALFSMGIPTPRVLVADVGGVFFDKPFLIQERAEGVSLDRLIAAADPSPHDLAKVLRQLGKHLRAMHSIRTAGFGPIDDAGVGRFKSWGEYLLSQHTRLPSGDKHRILDLGFLLAEGVLTAELVAAIQDIYSSPDETFPVSEPLLLHNDLTLKNTFVDPDKLRITAIIDLHNAIGGDPMFDLARFRYFYRGRGYYRDLLLGYGGLSKDIELRQTAYLVFVIVEKLFFLIDKHDRFPGRLESDVSLLRSLTGLSGTSGRR